MADIKCQFVAGVELETPWQSWGHLPTALCNRERGSGRRKGEKRKALGQPPSLKAAALSVTRTW